MFRRAKPAEFLGCQGKALASNEVVMNFGRNNAEKVIHLPYFATAHFTATSCTTVLATLVEGDRSHVQNRVTSKPSEVG